MLPFAAVLALTVAAAAPAAPPTLPAASPAPAGLADMAARVKGALLARHGEAQRPRIERGVDQVVRYWRATDGSPEDFAALALAQFEVDDARLASLLGRFEENLEELDGRALQVNRTLSRHAVLDIGPEMPVDALFAAFDAGAHLNDDLYETKLALVALLNFPLTTLDERTAAGGSWSRRRWAEARLLGRRGALAGSPDGGIAARVPGPVNQRIARSYAESQAYVASYNLYVHHLLGPSGERLFPKGKRLLSHWNLRDEVKSQYGEAGGLARQRALARAMERIVTQEIPAAVVNAPYVDWNPFTNQVAPAPADTIEGGGAPARTADPAREPDTRYAMLLANFRAVREADPYTPTAPSAIARKFQVGRELSEERVTAMLEEIVTSPLVARTGKLVAARLGRPLEPFDLWYAGFRSPGPPESELDARTRARYPTAAAYRADMPRLLEGLGFSPSKARWLADRIVVEPARGSGHAMQAATRDDQPRLRTRVGPDGMDYKGYNIAVHEMGHNVEQVFSLYGVDHTLLSGVPNNAFTEALAFVFQARDRELLGLPPPTAADLQLDAIADLWSAYEISGVALVDIQVWKWLYANPDATPARLREAVVDIAKGVWNRYYAPVFGVRDVPLLAIYSHMIEEPLYLADYPLGIVIAAQLEERFRKAGAVGPEFERMATFGSLAPDLWMRNATGEPLSTRALLDGASKALDAQAR